MKSLILAMSAMSAIMIGLTYKATAQTTQYVTVAPPSSAVPVQPNQMISVVGYDWVDLPQIYGRMTNGISAIALTPYHDSLNSGSAPSPSFAQMPQTVTGLTNISVSGGGWATFQITTPSSGTVITNYVPADAIVIPTSATGNVQIILESSADLANWTAASPGSYSAASATNRFFRVRAVLN